MDQLKYQLESILECPLCMSLICQPLSISCGHSFCRMCLVRSLSRHKKKCPTCRAICHISAESAEENVMLKNLCLTFFPQEYEAREVESQAEKASWSTLLPIFYYNDCQFPGYVLRLHLFEPRYKTMMQRIVNTTRCFAYVPNFDNYRANIGDVALIARITECEFMPDGRCLLEAKLTERKKIIDHFVEDGTQGLHFCRVEDLEDELIDTSNVEHMRRLNDCLFICRNFSNHLLQINRSSIESTFGPPPPESDPQGFSLWMAAVCPLPTSTKTRLLASKNTVERLEMVMNGFITLLGRTAIADTTANHGSLADEAPEEENEVEEEEQEEQEEEEEEGKMEDSGIIGHHSTDTQ